MLPRSSALGNAFRPSAGRIARVRARPQNWRQVGRRYASDHGHGHKSGSDLPWMIGSTVITVPAAAWLWQQGPKKDDHGHGGHGHEHGEHEEGEESEGKEGDGEKAKDEGGEVGKDEGGEEPTDEGEDKAESKSDDDKPKEDDKSEDSGSDSDSEEGKDTPDTSADESDDTPDGHVTKGKGEKQKGPTRPKTETKGQKDSASDRSGAQNPYMNSPEKSKKGEGITETAKIHGTVDPQRKARGVGEGAEPDKDKQGKPQDE